MAVTTVEITLEEALNYSNLRYRNLVEKLLRLAEGHMPLAHGSARFVERVRDVVEDLELENNKIQAYAGALLERDRASRNSSETLSG